MFVEQLRKTALAEANALGLRWGRQDGTIVTRAAVVAEAREWMNTPFMHQQEIKGVGVDCGGLIRGVSVALGLLPPDYRLRMPPSIQAYQMEPYGDIGEKMCDHYWIRKPLREALPGDVVTFQWLGGPARHAAFITDYPNAGWFGLVHSLNFNPGRVCEHRFDDTWKKRVISAYSLPGVEQP